ncbi:MAG TPA: hypothetical protein VK753_00880 [Xanthomonadaceae bacterium]|jgi:hypothetical protein|nr:hypothetical protein [Xanthomonadaceae bacterium]
MVCAIGSAGAADANSLYPVMAPIGKYRMASATEEVAMARSAAPASISADADVMTLGEHGYESAAKGKNGFVCMVWRSWAASFGDPEFWNPKIRGPICLNPAAVRSVLPGYLERTKWVLAGVSRSDMLDRTKAAITAKTYVLPEPVAMSYMMSKQQYVSDSGGPGGGHWHPHLMFFVAHTDAAAWGADLKNSPIFSAQGDPEPVTTFFVPVSKWSDGTSAVMEMH